MLTRHPSIQAVMQYFDCEHLTGDQHRVSEQFHALAWRLFNDSDLHGPQLTLALQHLLTAKDAAVRASLPDRPIARVQEVFDPLAHARQNAPVATSTEGLDLHGQFYPPKEATRDPERDIVGGKLTNEAHDRLRGVFYPGKTDPDELQKEIDRRLADDGR